MTNNQIRAYSRWFGPKVTTKTTKTGLINGIRQESEARKTIYQACFAEKKQGAHDKYNSKSGPRAGIKSLESVNKEKRLITKTGIRIVVWHKKHAKQ